MAMFKSLKWSMMLTLAVLLLWPSASAMSEDDRPQGAPVETVKQKPAEPQPANKVRTVKLPENQGAEPERAQPKPQEIPADVPEAPPAPQPATTTLREKPAYKTEVFQIEDSNPPEDKPDAPPAPPQPTKRTGEFPEIRDFVAVERMPAVKHEEAPVYPQAALDQHAEGDVWVAALVDKEGLVRDVVIQKPSDLHVGFEEAAMEAARKARYEPAIQNGEPAAVWVTYKVEFRLDGNRK